MIVPGKALAKEVEHQTREYIQSRTLSPRLAIFVVGTNPATDMFVRLKQAYGERIGVRVSVWRYPESITEEEFTQEITRHSSDADGIVVQLPLPSHIDRSRVRSSIPKEKDPDMLNDARYHDFVSGSTTLLPPVVGAVLKILNTYRIDLSDKKTVVVGTGLLVGQPMIDWLKREGYQYHIVSESTPENERRSLLREADVVVSGTGIPESITEDMVSDGVVLIDVGAGDLRGKICGDISRSCEGKASVFSAVPGGVGPLTVAMLFYNLVYNDDTQ